MIARQKSKDSPLLTLAYLKELTGADINSIPIGVTRIFITNCASTRWPEIASCLRSRWSLESLQVKLCNIDHEFCTSISYCDSLRSLEIGKDVD